MNTIAHARITHAAFAAHGGSGHHISGPTGERALEFFREHGPQGLAGQMPERARSHRVGAYVVKRYKRRPLDALMSGAAPRAFRNGCRAIEIGICTPLPLLCWRGPHSSWLILEWVEGQHPARQGTGRIDRQLASSIGRFVAGMHAAGCLHRDLKAPNLLITDDGSICVLDLDGARFHRRLNTHQRGRDLSRVLRAFPDATANDIRAFVAGYMGKGRDRASAARELVARTLEAVAVKHRQGVRGGLKPQVRSILVIDLNEGEDLELTGDAVRRLALAYPRAQITALVREGSSRELLLHADRILEETSSVPGTLHLLRRDYFDLCIDLQGTTRTALIAAFSGSAARIGPARGLGRIPGVHHRRVQVGSTPRKRVAALLLAAGASAAAHSDWRPGLGASRSRRPPRDVLGEPLPARWGVLQRAKNTALYWLVVGLFGVARHTPLSLCRLGVRPLAFMLQLLARGARRRALAQLAVGLPELASGERRVICKKMFQHLVRSGVELAHLDEIFGDENAVTLGPEARRLIDDALATGKGVIVATGHIGNCELMAQAWVKAGYPLSTVAAPLYDPRLTRWAHRLRTARGLEVIYRGELGAAKRMLSVFRQGKALSMLLDIDMKIQGVFVPFFGRLAYTPAGPAVLALRTGAPVIVLWANRVGNRHECHGRAVDFVPTGDREADITELTARMTAVLEHAIRLCPEQWIWLNKRWKRQPEDTL